MTLGLVVAGPGVGADHEDFTGVWKLDLEESRMPDGSALPFNKSHVLAIVYQEPTLRWSEQRITSDDQLISHFAVFDTHGEEASLSWYVDGELTTDTVASVRWEGEQLVFRFRGSNFEGSRKMTLAKGGGRLEAEFRADRFGEPVAWTEVWKRF
jgi:hypothetical protein